MPIWDLSDIGGDLPYEEGFFLPVLQFGGSITGITYSKQYGFYTKIGNVVNIYVIIDLTSKGTATGAAGIIGLPFASQHYDFHPMAWMEDNMNLLNEVPQWTVRYNGINTTTERFGYPSSKYSRIDSDFYNDSYIRLMGTYFTTED